MTKMTKTRVCQLPQTVGTRRVKEHRISNVSVDMLYLLSIYVNFRNLTRLTSYTCPTGSKISNSTFFAGYFSRLAQRIIKLLDYILMS